MRKKNIEIEDEIPKWALKEKVLALKISKLRKKSQLLLGGNVYRKKEPDIKGRVLGAIANTGQLPQVWVVWDDNPQLPMPECVELLLEEW